MSSLSIKHKVFIISPRNLASESFKQLCIFLSIYFVKIFFSLIAQLYMAWIASSLISDISVDSIWSILFS